MNTPYVQNKYSQYITKHEVIAPKSGNILCSFCHFDANGKIAPYVVHYLKELKAAGADVYFVSNNHHIEEDELQKIRSFVTQIILRQNVGYDFACYFTGYEIAKNEEYEHLIFANDSVYGPFCSLAPIFQRMQEFDMWGISDASAGHWHMQSYFWSFKLTSRMQEFLGRILSDFIFTSVKAQVVGLYEEGISQSLSEEGFNIGILCASSHASQLEREGGDDTTLLKLKANIAKKAARKVKPWSRLAAMFNPEKRRRNEAKIKAHTNSTGIFSNWYVMVKHMGCPFIKVGMVKKPGMEIYHEFSYIDVIRQKYPAYDLNLIENHRKNLY